MVGILNHEAVLAALPNSKGDAKSLKDCACNWYGDIHTYGLGSS
jgi:hypothetical protein